MRNFIVVTVVGVATVLNSSTIFAQNVSQCTDILDSGTYDYNVVFRDQSTRSYLFNWFCSQNYGSNSSTMGLDLSAVYESFSGAIGYNEKSFNEFQNSNCSQEIRDFTQDETTFILSNTVNENVVSKWSECMQANNTGLACRAKRVDQNNSQIYQLFFEIDNSLNVAMTDPEISYSGSFQPSGGTGFWSAIAKFNRQDEVGEGEYGPYEFVLPSQNPDSDQNATINARLGGTISITGMMGNVAVSCTASVPSLPIVPEIDAERSKIATLIGTGYENGPISQTYHTIAVDGARCTSWVDETLSIEFASVNQEKNRVTVGYYCSRPNSRYDCGTPAVSVVRDDYRSSVIANISISNGTLSIDNIIDRGATPERTCGGLIVEKLVQLDGFSLQ